MWRIEWTSMRSGGRIGQRESLKSEWLRISNVDETSTDWKIQVQGECTKQEDMP
jgi:hypothetical protein